MGAVGLSGDHAFELLKSVSQADNVKVRNVAQRIVECWGSEVPRPGYDAAAQFLATVRRRINADWGARVGRACATVRASA